MTTDTKTYAAKASAVRAAKRQGIPVEAYSISVNAEGRYYIEFTEQPDDATAADWAANAKEPTPKPVHTPAPKPELPDEGEVTLEQASAADPDFNKQMDAALTPADETKADEALANRLRKSTIEKPTKRVWTLAEEYHAANPDAKRKDVIAHCVAQGIAFYTARTQYQAWRTACKASEITQAAAAAAAESK